MKKEFDIDELKKYIVCTLEAAARLEEEASGTGDMIGFFLSRGAGEASQNILAQIEHMEEKNE